MVFGKEVAAFGFGIAVGVAVTRQWLQQKAKDKPESRAPRKGSFDGPPPIGRRQSAPSDWLRRLSIPQFPDSGIMLGMDIGGTLSKVVICLPSNMADSDKARKLREYLMSRDTIGTTGKRDKQFDVKMPDGVELIFVKYETARSINAINIMKSQGSIGPGSAVGCTGGGAIKYNKIFQREMRLGWVQVDEMEALVSGVSYLIQNVPQSIYEFERHKEEDMPKKRYLSIHDQSLSTYPRLVVNVGSGVSVLYCEGPKQYRRVGGSPTGGATFYGLARLLTGCKSFSEALALAKSGDSTNVDLLVGDIYGGHYTKLGLSADMIAAYFGKLAKCDAKKFSKEDLVAAVLKLITYTIGSTAWLYARIYRPKRLVFTGNFLSGNDDARHRIAYMVQTLSKGETSALFMEREGYFGALGALLHAREEKACVSRDSSPRVSAMMPRKASSGGSILSPLKLNVVQEDREHDNSISTASIYQFFQPDEGAGGEAKRRKGSGVFTVR